MDEIKVISASTIFSSLVPSDGMFDDDKGALGDCFRDFVLVTDTSFGGKVAGIRVQNVPWWFGEASIKFLLRGLAEYCDDGIGVFAVQFSDGTVKSFVVDAEDGECYEE